jgi:hypothetical protein
MPATQSIFLLHHTSTATPMTNAKDVRPTKAPKPVNRNAQSSSMHHQCSARLLVAVDDRLRMDLQRLELIAPKPSWCIDGSSRHVPAATAAI